jgi:hypothetical protein
MRIFFVQIQNIHFMKIFIFLIITTLYTIPNLIAQNWKEVNKQLPEKAMRLMPNGFYGKSMDIDGDYAVIGASNYATVLYFDGSDWVQQAELSSSSDNINFGASVSISGDAIVVGSSGKAYVFQKPISGWADMTENAILSATNSTNTTLGLAVSIYGDNIIVGNYSYNNNVGCAYIYSKPISGWMNMTQTAILTPNGGNVDDYFGFSVDLSNDAAIIGMPHKTTASGLQGTGKAMVFVKPSTGWTTTAGNILLNASDAPAKAQLGFSVSISGDCIVLGARTANMYGQAYVYEKAIGGWNSSTETAILRQRIRPADTIPTNTVLFGQSVSISGDKILVGGYDYFADYNLAGFAYLFTKPNTGWQDTTETARLTSFNRKLFNYFGATVSLDGDHVMVGATHYGQEELGVTHLGAIYTYEAPNIAWVDTTETGLIISPVRLHATQNRFGNSVDIDGDYAAISSFGFANNMGRVSVYYYNGTNWILQAHLLASDSTNTMNFGTSVSILGDCIIVGAPKSKTNNIPQGAVYLYQKPSNGWVDATETAKLIASDGATDDHFGFSISISGDDLVIGANRADDLGNNSGAAYVFTKPTTGWISGTETAKLLPSDGATGDTFGGKVDIDGSSIAVGSPNIFGFGTSLNAGAAYVFVKPTTGWLNMTETAKLSSSDGAPGDYFGTAISIYGDEIVIGASKNNQIPSATGAAYVFSKPINGWNNTTEDAKLTVSNGASIYGFGTSVALLGNQIIVGTPSLDDLGPGSGGIYTFVKPNTGWVSATENTKILTTDGRSREAFGASLAISENYLLVGAPNAIYTGATYFFKSCPMTIIDTTIAQGTSISVGNNTYNTSGIYRDTFPTQDCDSIVVTNLSVGLSIQQTLEEYNSILTLYPNPSTGLITFDLSQKSTQGTMEVEVFDRLGKLVYHKKNQSNKLNLERLPKGLYLLRVNQKYSQSFILSGQ